ncbi:hypothetical protein BDV98DRAFT_577503 [Pterulicium gracile]|uniref:GDP/GTP exchange factor Sec2 N-terminal domain-containing protein n=1 Tax=Pterulicium gracile TaxID=1884261 RepID=A0A5C3QB00_9AGAR|nr:hypothetical protein BDV98DRAFT_577503 [Pterula gracilis]
MFASFSPTPASTSPNSARPSGPQRYDSLNATQTAAKVPPLFLAIEEELHDARRVHSHGQEEDLKYALNRAINRISELSNLLQDALKTQSDLETQLGVAKSNLKLVIANNEMLEDALKRDSSIRDVGWNRGSTSGRPRGAGGGNNAGSRSASMDQDCDGHSPLSPTADSPTITNQIPSPLVPGQQQDSKFFRFRFNSSSGSSGSRPGTPRIGQAAAHLTSPSMPTLPLQQGDREKEKELEKEMSELAAKLEEEKKKHKKACEDKTALEDELESLSAALFEEANKMVATERIKLHETTEELHQAQLEKEALRSALKLIEGENKHLRTTSQSMGDLRTAYGDGGGEERGEARSRSRSSSVTGVKSRPVSVSLNGASGSQPAPVVPPPRQDSKDVKSKVQLDSAPAADLAASSSTASLDEEGYGTPEEEPSGLAASPLVQKADSLAQESAVSNAQTASLTSPSTQTASSISSPTDVSASHPRPSSPSSLSSPSSDSNSPSNPELRAPENENESDRTPAPRSPLVLPPVDSSPWAS